MIITVNSGLGRTAGKVKSAITGAVTVVTPESADRKL